MNGATVEDEGRRAPELITSDGKKRKIGFSVAGVRRALLSVSKSIDHGNRVIFDSDGSYVENKKSGERTAIERKNGVFTMKFWVAPRPVSGQSGGGVRTLAPYAVGAGTGSTVEGHPPVRQAWPYDRSTARRGSPRRVAPRWTSTLGREVPVPGREVRRRRG